MFSYTICSKLRENKYNQSKSMSLANTNKTNSEKKTHTKKHNNPEEVVDKLRISGKGSSGKRG